MLGDEVAQAVLADPDAAQQAGTIGEPLRAMLAVLRKVTRAHASVTADDMRGLLRAGLARRQIEDALDVSFAFNVITRLADAFEFHVGPPSAFAAGARYLLTRGYRRTP